MCEMRGSETKMKLKNLIFMLIVLMSTQLGFADSKADSDFVKVDT